MYNRFAEEMMGYSDLGYDIIETTEVVREYNPEDFDDDWTIIEVDWNIEMMKDIRKDVE